MIFKIVTSTLFIVIFSIVSYNSNGSEKLTIKTYRSEDVLSWEDNDELLKTNQADSNYLESDKESGCLCRTVPRRVVVCFGRDKCYKIPKNVTFSTPKLILTSTHIRILGPGNFSIFKYAESLQIEGNFVLSKILPGTFNANMTNLTNLSISFNPHLNSLEPKIFQGLISLKALFLLKNGFTILLDITLNLSPNILPNLLQLTLNENNFVNITKADFIPMDNSSLKELNMMLCRLNTLDPDAFVPLKHLRILRLGENNFDVNNITSVIQKMNEINIPLRLLNLHFAGFRNKLPYYLLAVISKSNINHLILSGNQFTSFSSDSFPYMPNIRILNLKDVYALEVDDDAFKNVSKLRTLLLSGNRFPDIPQGILVPTLRYLDLQNNAREDILGSSYFIISNNIFANMSNLIYLNLNFNNIYHLFNGSFIGLENLQVLVLKNATIYHIANFTFAPLKELVLLNLENNDFVRHNYPMGLSCEIFHGLYRLRILLLSGCNISYFSLYSHPFIYLKSLMHLGLSKNEITSIHPHDLAPLVNLQSIDLSYNYLKVWDERLFLSTGIMKSILLHHNKLTYFSTAMLDDFCNITELDLSFNSFTCDCFAYKHFQKWLSQNPKNTVWKMLGSSANCIFPLTLYNFSVSEYFENIQNRTIICDKGTSLKLLALLPIGLLFLFFILLAIFVYCYRWHIKYWIFLNRLYLSRNGKVPPKKEKACYLNYTYDAFVSYSNKDRNFVIKLVSMLENFEPYLKLCVYERDFQIGSYISECILESVAKSRKTILIISDSYAKSVWCRWESNLAEHHRLFFENEDGKYVDDTLILVKLGPVNISNLTPTLKYLLKTRIYLQWEAEETKQIVFWKKLRQILSPPKRESIEIESTYI